MVDPLTLGLGAAGLIGGLFSKRQERKAQDRARRRTLARYNQAMKLLKDRERKALDLVRGTEKQLAGPAKDRTEDIMGRFGRSADQLRAEQAQRLGDISQGFGARTAEQRAAGDALVQDLVNRQQEAERRLVGLGEGSRQNIREQYGEAAARRLADLEQRQQARGMGNLTISGARGTDAVRGILADQMRAERDLDDRIRAESVGQFERMSGDIVNARGRQNEMMARLVGEGLAADQSGDARRTQLGQNLLSDEIRNLANLTGSEQLLKERLAELNLRTQTGLSADIANLMGQRSDTAAPSTTGQDLTKLGGNLLYHGLTNNPSAPGFATASDAGIVSTMPGVAPVGSARITDLLGGYTPGKLDPFGGYASSSPSPYGHTIRPGGR